MGMFNLNLSYQPLLLTLRIVSLNLHQGFADFSAKVHGNLRLSVYLVVRKATISQL